MSRRQRAARVWVPALVFVTSLALYLPTLAPTVTFEDSGELIAAARTLGVPHSPGYPTYTLIGHAFSRLPVGNVAYRLNLMSALLSALAAALVAATALRILDAAPGRSAAGQAAAFAAGLWFATAHEVWEQSIIAEVYALNACFVALFLLLLGSWDDAPPRAGRRVFVGTCALVGLSLTNHVTALGLIPALGLYLALKRERWSLAARPRMAAWGLLAFLAGLTPYVYLPLASRRNPAMDWGDPEDLGRLLRNVFDYPYRDEPRTLRGTLDPVLVQLQQLTTQWFPVVLVLAAVGLIWLWRARRSWFWFFVGFLLLSGPLLALGAPVEIDWSDPDAVLHTTEALSVYFIPSYLAIALLMGLGSYGLASAVRGFPGSVVALALAVLPLPFAVATYRDLDMSAYYYAEDYAENLFRIAGPDSIVWASSDPYYFPLLYYQIVAERRPDLLLIDPKLLRNRWYVNQLVARYPDRFRVVRTEVEEFLQALRPVEEGRPYDGNAVQRSFETMIHALIERSGRAGTSTYFTYLPPAGIAGGRFLESRLVAWEVSADRWNVEPLDPDTLRFRGFGSQPEPPDRWVRAFAGYYGWLFCDRATHLESLGRADEALDLFRRASRFAGWSERVATLARDGVSRLERMRTDRTPPDR